MPPALPRIINRHRQRAEPGTPDQRDTLIIRVDRKPTDDEARALWASDDLCKDRESSVNTKVVFHWPTEQEVSLNTLGFFSPEIETFRAHVHSSPEAKIWLHFAQELTTFGLEMLSANDFPTDEGDRLTAAALFGRAHESMQASVTLAERGMIGDARAVARSAVENAIALHALAGGDNFTERLVCAKAHVDLQAARMLLEVASVRAQLTALAGQEGWSVLYPGHGAEGGVDMIVAQGRYLDLTETLVQTHGRDGTLSEADIAAITAALESLTGVRGLAFLVDACAPGLLDAERPSELPR